MKTYQKLKKNYIDEREIFHDFVRFYLNLKKWKLIILNLKR